MATVLTSIRFAVLATTLLIVSHSAAVTDVQATFGTTPPPQQTPHGQHPSPDLQDQSFFSNTALLGPILSHLGFNELATAAPSLVSDSYASAWSGPFTLFAPSDSSLRTCYSCSVPSLLREHLVPGLFPIDYLLKLAFGTKVETLSPGRCITITSSTSQYNNTAAKIFIGGMEITHPDLFNNGLVIIHGIQGYVSPLSPLSCDVERMTSLSFPFQPSERSSQQQQVQYHPPIMRLMLRDAILRLRNNGFNILSLAFKVKYPELVTLNNMTVFAVDDVSIFSGLYSYISNVRFHIVPNRYLTAADLEKLPVRTELQSLERGQSLVVTTAGGLAAAAPFRINYVRVKNPEVMKNMKIVVHSVYLPFPHLHTNAYEGGVMGGGGTAGLDGGGRPIEGECSLMDEHAIGACGGSPVNTGTVTGIGTATDTGTGIGSGMATGTGIGSGTATGTDTGTGTGKAPSVSKVGKLTVEIEDHHML